MLLREVLERRSTGNFRFQIAALLFSRDKDVTGTCSSHNINRFSVTL
ncbi:hypothetical protein VDG1235_4889 [Verrucomicrobiia bacterium DG1235]|nr:hypothetical protein VDG1235_4889 [Verrucomicrobiae bacterium DG1235]